MDSLLCDEVWLEEELNNDVGNSCIFNSKEDCEEAFEILLDKEMSYMPKIGYMKFIKENCFIENARFKAMHWLIKVISSFSFL